MLVKTHRRLHPRRERVDVRMNDVPEQLETVHESRPRSAEVRRTVRDVYVSIANRGDIVPTCDMLKHADLLHGTLGGKSAARDEHDFGLPRNDLFPTQHARLLASGAESVHAARE